MTWTEDFLAAVDDRIRSTLCGLDTLDLLAAARHAVLGAAFGPSIDRALALRGAARHGRRAARGAYVAAPHVGHAPVPRTAQALRSVTPKRTAPDRRRVGAGAASGGLPEGRDRRR